MLKSAGNTEEGQSLLLAAKELEIPNMVIRISDAPSGFQNHPSYTFIGRRTSAPQCTDRSKLRKVNLLGLDGYFGNPVTKYNRCPECGIFHKNPGDTLPCYERQLIDRIRRDHELASAVSDLFDQILVCFCAPQPCHGIPLRRASVYMHFGLL